MVRILSLLTNITMFNILKHKLARIYDQMRFAITYTNPKMFSVRCDLCEKKLKMSVMTL